MLAALENVPNVNEPNTLNFFSFNNYNEHILIVQAIANQTTGATQLYVPILDPIPMEDLQNWLLRHQIVHNQMNAVTGTGGNDLTEVDFNDPDALESWIDLHFSEHQDANRVLGI